MKSRTDNQRAERLPASQLHSVCSMSADELIHEPTMREFLARYHTWAAAAHTDVDLPVVVQLVHSRLRSLRPDVDMVHSLTDK